MRRALACLLATCLVLPAVAAWAVDGVLEINQACAVNTGCFAGDAAGFPVTIANSGSYRLTGPLSVAAGTNGLSVVAPRVSIDLNGFEIAGAGSCTGFPASSCSGSGGSGIGISGIETLTVRNGIVRGFFDGISAKKRGVVIEDVAAEQNEDHAIVVGQNARVSGCRAIQNGGNGLFLTDDDNNAATFPNGLAIAENTVASGNGGSGIFVSSVTAARVSDNVADNNALKGISLGSGGAVAGNVVYDNGTGTIQFGSAVETGVNLCNGSTTCP